MRSHYSRSCVGVYARWSTSDGIWGLENLTVRRRVVRRPTWPTAHKMSHWYDVEKWRHSSSFNTPPRKSRMGYQPMSSFRKHWNATRPSPLVNKSPSWLAVGIFKRCIFHGTWPRSVLSVEACGVVQAEWSVHLNWLCVGYLGRVSEDQELRISMIGNKSLPAVDKATYSASIVDSAISVWSLIVQRMGQLWVMTYKTVEYFEKGVISQQGLEWVCCSWNKGRVLQWCALWDPAEKEWSCFPHDECRYWENLLPCPRDWV